MGEVLVATHWLGAITYFHIMVNSQYKLTKRTGKDNSLKGSISNMKIDDFSWGLIGKAMIILFEAQGLR